MEFLQRSWEVVLQLSVALGILAGILISVYVIVTKTSWFKNKWAKHLMKKRLSNCPQTEIIAAQDAISRIMAEESLKKVKELHTQLNESNSRTTTLHGSHLVLFCMFAKFRGFLPRYEREWLATSFEEYTDSGGNHGVGEIYAETMELPLTPKRRSTDMSDHEREKLK